MLFRVIIKHHDSHYDWDSEEIVVDALDSEQLRNHLKELFEDGAPQPSHPLYDWRCADRAKQPHGHHFKIQSIYAHATFKDGVIAAA